MATPKKPSIKLRKIKIENFKAIDSLELDFPAPVMGDEPDVFVMGSKNGIGKTSVLEACALLLFRMLSREDQVYLPDLSTNFNPLGFMVKAGKHKATIEGEFLIKDKKVSSKIEIDLSGKITLISDKKPLDKTRKVLYGKQMFGYSTTGFWTPFFGKTLDPVLVPPLLYFHSFRKVAEGNPELGRMVGEEPSSSFKLEILRLMMGHANLFENIDAKEPENSLEKLNFLMEVFAGGVINKLRPSKDNTVDIRITTLDGNTSFTFDGLSSGQKEIISTLYLIWKYTREVSSIVLIDEPELHLNHEWHSRFIRQLHELAPDNQYIMATHSEKFFESAPIEKRVLLEPGNPPKRKKAKKLVSRAR